MATIINNPGNGEKSDSSTGIIIGVIVLFVFGALFFIYGLPAIRDNNANSQNDTVDVNVNLPKTDTSQAP